MDAFIFRVPYMLKNWGNSLHILYQGPLRKWLIWGLLYVHAHAWDVDYCAYFHLCLWMYSGFILYSTITVIFHYLQSSCQLAHIPDFNNTCGFVNQFCCLSSYCSVVNFDPLVCFSHYCYCFCATLSMYIFFIRNYLT